MSLPAGARVHFAVAVPAKVAVACFDAQGRVPFDMLIANVFPVLLGLLKALLPYVVGFVFCRRATRFLKLDGCRYCTRPWAD